MLALQKLSSFHFRISFLLTVESLTVAGGVRRAEAALQFCRQRNRCTVQRMRETLREILLPGSRTSVGVTAARSGQGQSSNACAGCKSNRLQLLDVQSQARGTARIRAARMALLLLALRSVGNRGWLFTQPQPSKEKRMMRAKRAKVRSSTAKKGTSKRPTATKGRKKSPTSTMTKQVKTTAIKVLQGAASGAMQALIPPLEEAAGASAKWCPGAPSTT